jgi:hypothetical protein
VQQPSNAKFGVRPPASAKFGLRQPSSARFGGLPLSSGGLEGGSPPKKEFLLGMEELRLFHT